MDPYIGITDFMTFAQVEAMLAIFSKHRKEDSGRRLHVGVMMSYKTLHGIPSKWDAVFPQKNTIADIFFSDETYNCLHYADYGQHPDLAQCLTKAISLGGTGIHALQLDMIWPNPREITDALCSSSRHIEVVMQIGRNALEEVGNEPLRVVERLQDYKNVIHRVLLDKSMGQGLGMDAEVILPFARAIRERIPALGLVVAGGLGPETMHLVEPIVKEFPEVSIDAQGRLRRSGSALDPIEWELAGGYLVKALELLN